MAREIIKGGDKLDAYLAAQARKLSTAATLNVGFFESATYPDGTSVALVAFLQNFGTGTIPPRPFFSNMVAVYGPEWPEQIAKLLNANNMDAEIALKLMGFVIEDELRQSIVDTNEPALSEITLMLRKMFGNSPEGITGKAVGEAAARVAAGESTDGVSDKPLILTGQMLRSVGSEVK